MDIWKKQILGLTPSYLIHGHDVIVSQLRSVSHTALALTYGGEGGVRSHGGQVRSKEVWVKGAQGDQGA